MNNTPRGLNVSTCGPKLESPRAVTTGATKTASWSTQTVYLGSVALDWLTLTTYDVGAFRVLAQLIEKHTPASARQSAQVMQYQGVKGDGYFVGMALQRDEKHYMLRLSGSLAMSFFLAAAASYPRALSLCKCTRADVQYTHDDNLEVDLSAVGSALREAEWLSHKGRRPRIDIFDNDDGLDTLYIGARSSPRMQRIYIKPIDDINRLRWEVEYKEQLALNLWQALLVGGIAVLPGILAGEMSVIPLAACPELLALPALVGAVPERLKISRNDTNNLNAIWWLWSSVLPCVRRLQSTDGKVKVLVREFLLSAFLGDDCDLPLPPPGMSLSDCIDRWEVVL
ncbi:hypothetical protein VSS37_07895 [Candidatus Thiothrix sp. Deng01]|uniref:Uncharacterized protein n=1 Tax=Candidatus Thiothrix phosphatis TaxID=3112415 RepID=A0ABU6CVN1_9GAMM|nr:hypothetical protein [Candidatus Thiothrix sp. Deng01]MEB4590895.1 hypothetical protein [Candidatus Thiothrix sp. Deng01]